MGDNYGTDITTVVTKKVKDPVTKRRVLITTSTTNDPSNSSRLETWNVHK